MNKDLELLLQLIASLTLCDHMGDVYNDIDVVLKKLGINYIDTEESYTPMGEFGSWVRQKLHNQGVTTLYGSSLL
jgi:hypothetical protein